MFINIIYVIIIVEVSILNLYEKILFCSIKFWFVCYLNFYKLLYFEIVIWFICYFLINVIVKWGYIEFFLIFCVLWVFLEMCRCYCKVAGFFFLMFRLVLRLVKLNFYELEGFRIRGEKIFCLDFFFWEICIGSL